MQYDFFNSKNIFHISRYENFHQNLSKHLANIKLRAFQLEVSDKKTTTTSSICYIL